MCERCVICGSYNIADNGHHIIKRSTNSALIKCRINVITLCQRCHQMIHHGNNSNELDTFLRWQMQTRMEMLFDREYFQLEEIRDILEITNNEAKRLMKTKMLNKEGYSREDILQAIMVKMVTEEEISKVNLDKYPESIFRGDVK